VYVAGVVIPGPNFVAVAHKAASTTRTEALAVVAGIVLVNLFWASCAILGVGIVFAAFPWLAFAVKMAGAAYLIWFGGRLIFKASAGNSQEIAQAPGGSLRQAFAQGFATNIANPKSGRVFCRGVFVGGAAARERRHVPRDARHGVRRGKQLVWLCRADVVACANCIGVSAQQGVGRSRVRRRDYRVGCAAVDTVGGWWGRMFADVAA
jgi:hypothetical protein